MKERYEVSVVVVTYNPDWIKLERTLVSILLQKNTRFEIVVTDDGSQKKYRESMEQLFERYGFNAYQIIDNKNNRGTVKNVQTGIRAATGKYIKTISPGDYLYHEYVLFDFVKYAEYLNAKVVFGNAVYYCLSKKNDICVLQRKASPQTLVAYMPDAPEKEQKVDYLVKDDLILGAALITEKTCLEKYIDLISDKVIYAEDNCYRLMVADGIRIVFCDNTMILYEYGSGISTKNDDIWNKRLQKDWHNTNRLICERLKEESTFNRKLKIVINSAGIWKKIVRYALFPREYLKRKKPRYTICQPDLTFFKKVIEA